MSAGTETSKSVALIVNTLGKITLYSPLAHNGAIRDCFASGKGGSVTQQGAMGGSSGARAVLTT